MAATSFDTLKFARRLKDSGVDDIQAEAQAVAIQEVFAEALEAQLATKGDIQTVMTAINELDASTQVAMSKLEARITLVQWMLGIVIAAQVLPLLRAIGVF